MRTGVGQNGSSAAIYFEAEPADGSLTEVALPIEGRSALALTPGQRFGLYVQSLLLRGRPDVSRRLLAAGRRDIPSTFGDVALAALACHAAAQAFDPHFPADWANESIGGPGWLRSGAGGCGVENGAGSAGEAACLVRGASTLGLQANLVSPWFSLLGQTSATLTYRGLYLDAPVSSNRLDLEIRTATADWALLLPWTTTHGNPGGEAVTIDLSAFAAEPRAQLRWRYSVSQGDSGLRAQVDQIRLSCSRRSSPIPSRAASPPTGAPRRPSSPTARCRTGAGNLQVDCPKVAWRLGVRSR